MAEKLKSCPFCGSQRGPAIWESHIKSWIECSRCDAKGPQSDSGEQAIRWWNEAPRPRNLKTLVARWSVRLGQMRYARERREREAYYDPEAKAEREKKREYKQWVQERQAWLNAPIPGDN